jgi:hypothetical protein
MDLRSVQRPLKEKYRSEPGTSRITLRARGKKTEQYCVVFQTLVRPPELEAEWA